MLTRRDFLSAVSAAGIASPLLAAPVPLVAARKRLAVITTVWWERSHAWHMAERFLHGYPWKGAWHQPPFEVVAAYVDQRPENDLSRQRAAEFGFSIYPTITESLRCGGDKMSVDAVLIIGEHGDYPNNEFGQKKYPRYEFFNDPMHGGTAAGW